MCKCLTRPGTGGHAGRLPLRTVEGSELADIGLSVGRSRVERLVARPVPAVAALLLGLILGCTAGPPDATPADTPWDSPRNEATGTSNPPAPPPRDDVVSSALAWVISLGPGAPSGPDEIVAYELLADPSEANCRELLDSSLPESVETLYRGAAAACLAALHGRSARWAEAEAAYEELAGRPDGCLSRAAYRLLETAVTAHRASPTVSFRIDRSSGVELPCPTIRRLSATRLASGALEISVRGDRLGQVRDVLVRDVADCPASSADLDDFLSASFTSSRRSLQARVDAGEVPDGADLLWLGLVAEPQPWIADQGCVGIESSGGPPADASASGDDDDASPTAEP
jgi:hypothetical protein